MLGRLRLRGRWREEAAVAKAPGQAARKIFAGRFASQPIDFAKDQVQPVPFDELHGVEVNAVVVAEPEHGDNMRML